MRAGCARLLRRNATYFPGLLALKLCPDFMGRVGKPKKIIAVTGSNGENDGVKFTKRRPGGQGIPRF
jgi:hypothetical protein